MSRHALLIVAALGLAGPAYADAVSDAKAVNEAFCKASQEKDNAKAIAGILDVFTDNMQHIGIFGRVKSKAELKAGLEKAFGAGQKVPCTIASQEGFVVDDTHVVMVAKLGVQLPGPDGKPGPAELRCTRTFEKQKDGKWKIAAEHTSFAPPAPAPPTKPAPAPAKK